MHRLGRLFRLADALDDLGDEARDVLVGDRRARLAHRLGGRLLDLRLGVPHEPVEDGDDLSQVARHLLRVLLGEVAEHLGAAEVALPLAVALGQHHRDDEAQRVRRQRVPQSRDDLVCGELHRLHLVRERLDDVQKHRRNPGLSRGAELGEQGVERDERSGALVRLGLALVGELRLEARDEPRRLEGQRPAGRHLVCQGLGSSLHSIGRVGREDRRNIVRSHGCRSSKGVAVVC
mmetsp:Transcript_3611/g.10565  ORF Transcript_3611/g.10565 Transcript_3611/m.10565 type:complete len:234 (+) Transcript_3611:1087-1788(+)